MNVPLNQAGRTVTAKIIPHTSAKADVVGFI
jgi:hypothetical protein